MGKHADCDKNISVRWGKLYEICLPDLELSIRQFKISLKVGWTLERLVRRLKVTKAFEFVTICFPTSWLLAIIAETRRVLVSFRAFAAVED